MKPIISSSVIMLMLGLAGVTLTSCQEKTIEVVGAENTGTDSEVEQLKAQVQTLKAELDKNGQAQQASSTSELGSLNERMSQQTSKPRSKASANKVTSVSSFKKESLVTIMFRNGGGSGFIVNTPDGVYVYTNAHVICNTHMPSVITSEGISIPVSEEIEFSNHFDSNNKMGLEDLARFKVNGDGLIAYELTAANAPLKMGDEVVAFGNSQAASVITDLPGEVTGIGGDRFEMSCQIVGGNSGGPVVSKKTGKVVGVTTYIKEGDTTWQSSERFANTRRFAIRPEKVNNWKKVNTKALFSFMAYLDGYKAGTRSLGAITQLSVKMDFRGFDLPFGRRGAYDLNALLRNPQPGELSKLISVQIERINERLGSHRNLSEAVIRPAYLDFFAKIRGASKAQTQSLREQKVNWFPFLQKEIDEMILERIPEDGDFLAVEQRFEEIFNRFDFRGERMKRR